MYGHAFSLLKKEAGAEIDSRHLLCLLLILERAKGEASLWHLYIQYLPQTYGAPHKIVCPKDCASDPCTIKLIFGSLVLEPIKYILQCPSELGFGICTTVVHSLSTTLADSVCALADDPLWWGEEEVALLGGTCLEIAVKQHHKIAAKLTCWRDQLVQLQR